MAAGERERQLEKKGGGVVHSSIRGFGEKEQKRGVSPPPPPLCFADRQTGKEQKKKSGKGAVELGKKYINKQFTFS